MQPMLRRSRGFTLVEIVVVMPLIILLIGAVVVSIVHTTNLALRSQARSQLQIDVLAALDMIERDVRASTLIRTYVNYPYVDAFATTKNPYDPTRRLVRASDCTPAASGLTADNALKQQIYYSYDSTKGEYRRVTTLPACTTSSNVWQKNATEVIIKDLTGLSATVSYTGDNAMTVKLTGKRRVAGQDIEYSGTMFVKSINI